MTGEKSVKREMALVCVKAKPENHEQIKQIITAFDGRILDESQQFFIFEVIGNENTIDELIVMLEPFGIKKLTRSGVLALYKES